jgi:hypothetical protein
VPIIEWAIHRLDPTVDILEPEFRKRKGPVKDFLDGYQSGAMLLFMHRDSESESLDARLKEFQGIERENVVPVITVRMTEAWLLVDSKAIACAADRPSAAVSLPSVGSLEGLADPKADLEDLLREAAGNLTGRKSKRFNESIVQRRVNVANRIEDFSALEALPAFRHFQGELAAKYPYGPS